MSKESTEIFSKRVPLMDGVLCLYDGIAYEDIPGYIDGYGCPICKGSSFYHLPILKEEITNKDNTNYETM